MHGFSRIAAFFLLCAVVAFGLDAAIDAGLRRIKTSDKGAFNAAMSGKVNAQIVINGSSRALVHYDPVLIQQQTGRSAYNLGRNGSHIDMQVAVLEAYLRRNDKPELVIQNLDPHTFIPTDEVYDPAQYMPYLHDESLYGALLKIHPQAWRWKYLPIYGYVVEDMRFTWLRGFAAWFGIHPREDHFRGYNPRDTQWTGDFERFKEQHRDGFKIQIDPKGVEQVEALIRLCHSRGIPLVLCYSPEYLEMQRLTSNRQELMGMFRQVAEKGHATFMDFSESEVCAKREHFYNSQHLNRQGSRLFSLELAKRLNNTISLNKPVSSVP
jgi:hypothetical protein